MTRIVKNIFPPVWISCRNGVLLFALAIATPGAASAAEFDHAALARQAIEGHIRPAYAQLQRTMSALSLAIAELCTNKSNEAFQSATAAFRNAVVARAGIEHIRFGPVLEDNRYERLAFWPDPKGIAARQVRRALKLQGEDLLDPATLKKKSVALQGLSALEVVLFSTGARDILSSDPKGAFRCGYAQAIAQNMQSIAEALTGSWNGRNGFSGLMQNPGLDNPVYVNPREVTRELVAAFVSGLVAVRDQKVERPLGGEFGPRPQRLEYRRSKLSKAAIVGSIDSIHTFYGKGGLERALIAHAPDRAGRAKQYFEIAQAMMDELQRPLDEAIQDEDGRGRLITLSLALSGIRSAVGKGLTLAAGLSLGFNANDGD